MPLENVTVTRYNEIQEVIRSSSRLAPRGAGSKTALQTTLSSVTTLNVSDLRGVLAYQPQEFTFTALAGTPLAEIERLLAENGQYLPFDPPLVGRGATLGGTVAAGLSGPGRYRYGGIRDFILGLRFIDGHGKVVRAGGKVVKNAAGFDLPKLMVGSLGRLGVMLELTFKVFPLPPSYGTLRSEFQALSAALDAMLHLGRLPLDIAALELIPHANGAALYIRLAGDQQILPSRLNRLRAILGLKDDEILAGQTEHDFWLEQKEFTWIEAAHTLVKVPVTPRRVVALDKQLAAHGAARRYSAGANLAWVAWPGDSSTLDHMLEEQGLSALAVLGANGQVRLGRQVGAAFEARVKQALDPAGKWLAL